MNQDANPETFPRTRREQRITALEEMRDLGNRIRTTRHRPEVYDVVTRLNLKSQAMAQRLLGTRRLDSRLSLLVPQIVHKPTPEEILHGEPEAPPLTEQTETSTHVLAGERLMQVACHIASAIECLNYGALIGKEDLQMLIRNYGQDAMRFGLKFRSEVPIWMLELLRGGDVQSLQLAATAILVWSELENQLLPADIRQNLSGLQPARVQTLDDPQETAELVRLALTATNHS